MVQRLAKLSILPLSSIAVTSTSCYAIYEKDFHINVLDNEFENGIKTQNNLKAAAFALKELYRIHLKNMLHVKNQLLEKYDLKTITEVIPTEIIAAVLNIHVNNDNSVDYNNVQKRVLECSGRSYKKLASYDQSNFNYLLLINVLDRCVGSNDSIDDIIKGATDDIKEIEENGKKKYGQYAKYITQAAYDLTQYFTDLKLYEFITTINRSIGTNLDVSRQDEIKECIRKIDNAPDYPIWIVGKISLNNDANEHNYEMAKVEYAQAIPRSSGKIEVKTKDTNGDEHSGTTITISYNGVNAPYDNKARNDVGRAADSTDIKITNDSKGAKYNTEYEIMKLIEKFIQISTDYKDQLRNIRHHRNLIFDGPENKICKKILLLSDVLAIKDYANTRTLVTKFRYNLINAITQDLWNYLKDDTYDTRLNEGLGDGPEAQEAAVKIQTTQEIQEVTKWLKNKEEQEYEQ